MKLEQNIQKILLFQKNSDLSKLTYFAGYWTMIKWWSKRLSIMFLILSVLTLYIF